MNRQGVLEEMAGAVEQMPGAVISGRSAAWLHGLDMAWSPIVVTVENGHHSNRSDVVVWRNRLPTAEVVRREGLNATSAVRSAVDLCRKLGRIEGVVAVDMALHARLVSMQDLATYALTHRGAHGISRVRAALELVDPKAESPMESRLRLLIVRSGLPRPESQVDLHDRKGVFLGRTDFYYPDQRLAIEYDGSTHRDSLAEDNRRQNRLLEAGYQLLRFTSDDVNKTPELVTNQVAAALGRRFSARKVPAGGT